MIYWDAGSPQRYIGQWVEVFGRIGVEAGMGMMGERQGRLVQEKGEEMGNFGLACVTQLFIGNPVRERRLKSY